LTELLAVIALISVLVVAASPTFIRLMRDRRVNRAAMQTIDYLRTARMMAIGRGLPILLTWDSAGNLNNAEPGTTGLIRVVEPIVTLDPALKTPGLSPTCGLTDFANLQPPGTAGGVMETARFDLKNGLYGGTCKYFADDTGTFRAYAEICFAPSGSSWIRTAPGAAFRRMTGVASFAVYNAYLGGTGFPCPGAPTLPAPPPWRTVFVPPNGLARMAL
jgi:type IV fimbrial biogenesis protein FimT